MYTVIFELDIYDPEMSKCSIATASAACLLDMYRIIQVGLIFKTCLD